MFAIMLTRWEMFAKLYTTQERQPHPIPGIATAAPSPDRSPAPPIYGRATVQGKGADHARNPAHPPPLCGGQTRTLERHLTMRTTYDTGSQQDTETLLTRFDGRIGAWDALAYSALVAMDYAEMQGSTAEAPLNRRVAQGLRELYLDFQELRAVLLANDQRLRAEAYPEHSGARE